MKHLLYILISSFLLLSCSTSKNSVTDNNDIKAFEKLRNDLGAAFANGDTATFAAYHHPNVVKSLAYNKLLIGRNAVVAEMAAASKYYSLNFIAHKIESFEIHGNTATEISSFTIEGVPKGNSPSFTFKGRSMVLYVRYKSSPSGWALLREMVQSATE